MTGNQLGETAHKVLERRYLLRDTEGNLREEPEDLWKRVATDLARPERLYGGPDEETVQDDFYRLLSRREFLPNSPTLMNAGTSLGQLAACFVLPVHDSLASIFDALKLTALIHQSGGGTGFSFSELRPAGDPVGETGGVASGPVSFMKIFDAATEQIKQGGRRRGANMGVLRVDHPDILEFIEAKREPGVLRNFNLSVATTEAFWSALENGDAFDLVNPRTQKTVDAVDPRCLLDRVAERAWETGDPGLLFLDTINRHNPTPRLGRLEATNPCGEVPLLPHEACVLGSVNLSRMSSGSEVDWGRLANTVQSGVRFLDNAIERTEFPDSQIAQRMRGNRKIGLGVMGFHDLLVDREISYDSREAVGFADTLMEFINDTARRASRDLAQERGSFPNWEASVYDRPLRNATRTTIAPTGTISLIADCSASIEPLYNVAYTKHVMGGLDVVSDRFVQKARDRGFYSEELMEKIRGRTTLSGLDEVPDDVRRLFPTAHDVSPERHLAVQAAFQRHVDNAVSKTVNLPKSATISDVRELFQEARRRNLKGITIFRSGSRQEQVLGEDPLKEECVSECDYSREPDEDDPSVDE